MRLASFGYPPANPEAVKWISLRGMVDLQGSDPHSWETKAFCPHCRVPLQAYDIRGALGWKLVAKEIFEHDAQPGFHHPDHKALPDCQFSYTHETGMSRAKHNAQLERKEIARNKDVLNDKSMSADHRAILTFLMYRVTGQEILSPQDSLLAERARARLITLPGLALFPYLMPFMQAQMLGSRHRFFGSQAHSEELQGSFIDELKREDNEKKRRYPRRVRQEVCYRESAHQTLQFKDLKGDERMLIVPQTLRLCFVYRSKSGVRHEPLHDQRTQRPIEFPVSASFAEGIAKKSRGIVAANDDAQRPARKRHSFKAELVRGQLRMALD